MNTSNETWPMFNTGDLIEVVFYSVGFVISALGNVTMFFVLLRNIRRVKGNRMYLLLLHLNVADLTVTFLHMPSKIAQLSLSVWYGPEWLCKLLRCTDVFGLYLSSNILVCMSFDRLMAVVRPLYAMRALYFVKILLVAAWCLAAASSGLQAYVFDVATHPRLKYRLCLTPNAKRDFAIFSTGINCAECYVLPTTAIIICYSMILIKIVQEERNVRTEADHRELTPQDLLTSPDAHKIPTLRRSSHFYLRRAKSRTLRMSVVIVLLFLVSWTPYYVMVAIDLAGQVQSHAIVRNILFAFAICNACINPYVYGYFSFKIKEELVKLLPCLKAVLLGSRDTSGEINARLLNIPGHAHAHRNKHRGLSMDMTSSRNASQANVGTYLLNGQQSGNGLRAIHSSNELSVCL